MACKYCDDTGKVNGTHCPCDAGNQFRKGIVVASKSEDAIVLTKDDQDKIDDISAYIEQKTIDYKTKKPKGIFDLLRYRFKDNGMMLFIYGPETNQDKVIARLKQVIAKYESKKRGTYKTIQPKPASSFLKGLLGK
jgi:hypothetical protein